jgi:hypothetical protein
LSIGDIVNRNRYKTVLSILFVNIYKKKCDKILVVRGNFITFVEFYRGIVLLLFDKHINYKIFQTW